MDLHHNLFYGYRGPDTVGADHDRQLENNLTKALINTLSLGGETVWRPFLEALGLADATGTKFLLQRRDLPSGKAAAKRDRMLVGISKKKSAWVPDGGLGAGGTYESVPDAWIYGDKFAVLVESKVNDGDFEPGQMQAHLSRLRTMAPKPPQTTLRTWAEMHVLLGHMLPRVTGAPQMLVGQLMEFLEYSGMSGFTGFRLDHFRYFLLRDDEDARRWVREQMECFAVEVLADLQKASPFYEACDVGILKLADSSCWVAFGPREKEYRKKTHQTISLGSDGLRVFVNTETKEATDRLKSVLKRPDPAFRVALQHLHTFMPFELVLQERVQRQGALFDYTPKMHLHSSLLLEGAGDLAWDAFAQTTSQLPLPYLRIERLVPPQALVADRARAVQHVGEILERNHTVVKLLNDPS